MVKGPSQRTGKGDDDEKRERMKECKNCGELFSIKLHECPACGWQVPLTKIVNAPDVVMDEIDFRRSSVPAKVSSWRMDDFTSRKGNRMVRISLVVSAPEWSRIPLLVNQYFDFAGDASLYGKSRARMDWLRLAGTRPPETVEEAIDRAGELNMPEWISIKRKDQYYNVARWSA